jgi:hypothetical protein
MVHPSSLLAATCKDHPFSFLQVIIFILCRLFPQNHQPILIPQQKANRLTIFPRPPAQAQASQSSQTNLHPPATRNCRCVCARRGPNKTSVTRVLEEAEAYQLCCLCNPQESNKSPIYQALAQCSLQEYRRLGQAIQEVYNAALPTARPQHWPLGQRSPIIPSA